VLTSTFTPHIAEIHKSHLITRESLVAGGDSFDAVQAEDQPGRDHGSADRAVVFSHIDVAQCCGAGAAEGTSQ
jgi:hypothetical protein